MNLERGRTFNVSYRGATSPIRIVVRLPMVGSATYLNLERGATSIFLIVVRHFKLLKTVRQGKVPIVVRHLIIFERGATRSVLYRGATCC